MNFKNKINLIILLVTAFMIASCNQNQEDKKKESTANNSEQTEPTGTKSNSDQESNNENQTAGIIDAYLELKNALVESSSDMARSAAEKMTEILEDEADSQLLKGILEDANHISDTDEMEHMREHFDLMSQNVYQLVKDNKIEVRLYKQYCPMAFDNEGAFWLSSEEEIKNPYFGDKMLKCGRVEETIQQ